MLTPQQQKEELVSINIKKKGGAGEHIPIIEVTLLILSGKITSQSAGKKTLDSGDARWILSTPWQVLLGHGSSPLQSALT